jgi:hypothetical protein
VLGLRGGVDKIKADELENEDGRRLDDCIE